MSCQTCGREEGHFLGCLGARAPLAPEVDDSMVLTDWGAFSAGCAHGDCDNPRRPKGKGPAPKYCTEHSDPKSRK